MNEDVLLWKKYIEEYYTDNKEIVLTEDNHCWFASTGRISIHCNYIFDPELNTKAKSWFSEKLVYVFYGNNWDENDEEIRFNFECDDDTYTIVVKKNDTKKTYYLDAFIEKIGWITKENIRTNPALICSLNILFEQVGSALRHKMNNERLPLLLGYVIEKSIHV